MMMKKNIKVTQFNGIICGIKNYLFDNFSLTS
uniref:ATP synthase subunit 8 n=1 Tax=Diabrotica barberi TaxID=50386 RepID=V5LG71_DIABR|nr:ATP synthase F0 subunit 8 [Diabrotica barberi]AHA51725.1 ATP synthase subunit 8 [Diabrotica barberi]